MTKGFKRPVKITTQKVKTPPEPEEITSESFPEGDMSSRPPIGIATPEESVPEPEEVVEEIEKVAPEPNKFENLLKMAGMDMSDVAQFMKPLMQPLILESAANLLNSMKIPEAIATAVEAKTTAMSAEVQASLSRLEANMQLGAAVQQTQQSPATNGGGLVEQLLLVIAQKFISGGGGNSNGMEGMAAMFAGMSKFMDLTANMYQGPRLSAQKELIDTMKAGYSIGLNTEQIITGADKTISQGLKNLVKPTAES